MALAIGASALPTAITRGCAPVPCMCTGAWWRGWQGWRWLGRGWRCGWWRGGWWCRRWLWRGDSGRADDEIHAGDEGFRRVFANEDPRLGFRIVLHDIANILRGEVVCLARDVVHVITRVSCFPHPSAHDTPTWTGERFRNMPPCTQFCAHLDVRTGTFCTNGVLELIWSPRKGGR